jgi:hypothetical protein
MGAMVQPRAEPQDWERVLERLEFPISLPALIRYARDVGGVDLEVHEVLSRLSRDSYDSLEQLVREVRDIYPVDGIPPDKLPL